MAAEFTPIYLFILVAIGAAAAIVTISAIFGPRRSTPVKQMPYESGMDPIGDTRQRFDVRYYLVAIAFLLFDVELLFLYPWAVAQWSADADVPVAAAGAGVMTEPLGIGVPTAFRGTVFVEALLFIAVLAAAFAYAWRKGVFEWR